MNKIYIFLLFVTLVFGCKGKKEQTIENDQSTKNDKIIIYYYTDKYRKYEGGYNYTIPSIDEIHFYLDDDYTLRNKTCVKIMELYKEIYYCDHVISYSDWASVGIDREHYDGLVETISKLLVDFLKTEESWSLDIKKELPLMKEISISEDNMVRIYNFDFMEWGTGDTYNNIIQYKTENGKINVIYISQYAYGQDRPHGFSNGSAYSIGFKIEEQTYLLWSIARGGGFTSRTSYLAIKLLDGSIEPYPIFNGDNNIDFCFGPQWSIDAVDHQFDEMDYWIKIIYNLREDKEKYPKFITENYYRYAEPYIYDILKFTYNGSVFLGDYKTFDEISRRWKE